MLKTILLYLLLATSDPGVPILTLTRGLDLSGTLNGAGGLGGLLAMTEPSGVHTFYHSDGNGNVTCLVNANQLIVAHATYDPFGRFLALSGPKANINRYWFSSELYDTDFGLYHYPRRVYAPALSRWLSQDPIKEAGGINLYAFVANSPLNRIDPFGFDYTELNPYSGKYMLGRNEPEPMFITVATQNPQWFDDLVQMLRYPGTGIVGSEFQGVAVQSIATDAEASMLRSMALARKLFPKLCGKFQNHHIEPIYLGGDPKGPTVVLEAPYHQLITNAFRNEYGYGQPVPDSLSVRNIVNTVYSKFPLPK